MENYTLEETLRIVSQKKADFESSNKFNKPIGIGVVLSSHLQKKMNRPKASEDKAKHQRAYWVELTRKALGLHWKTNKPYSFGQINGMTRTWTVNQIRDRYHYVAKSGGLFPKVWFGIIKQEKELKIAEAKVSA